MDRHVRDFLPELDDRGRFPHVAHHAAYVGFGGPRFVLTLTPMDPAPNVAFLVIDVDAPEHMDETIEALRTRLATRWPEFDARVARMFLGPSDPNLLEVQVQGPDEAVVFETTKAVEEILGAVPGAIDVRSDWENRISLIRVAVDQVQARRAGVSSADVARALEGYFSGRVASRFREEDEVFPIVSRALEEERTDLDRLRTLRIFGRGENPARSVPLVQVADVRLENRWSRIRREQMQPAATVEARNLRLTAEDTVPRIDAALRELEG
jgi:multidrug efflux pump subunit AcrB